MPSDLSVSFKVKDEAGQLYANIQNFEPNEQNLKAGETYTFTPKSNPTSGSIQLMDGDIGLDLSSENIYISAVDKISFMSEP